MNEKIWQKEQEKIKSIEQKKIAEEKFTEGIGQVSEYTTEFVQTLLRTIWRNQPDTELYTQLAKKMRAKD